MATKPTLTRISEAVLNTRLKKEKNKNFNFVFLGDSWFDWGTAKNQTLAKAKSNAIRRYQILLSCLNTAAKLNPKPLFILYGGDGVFSGSVAQLTVFRNAVAKFVKKHQIPFFMVPGNHERNGLFGSLENYQSIIGPAKGTLKENHLNYILNTPNLRMIMLNDVGRVGPVPNGAKYGITTSALNTFTKGIKTGKRVLVVMHVPPKVDSFAGFPSDEAFPVTTANDKAFLKRLKNAKNVELVLVSHIHDKRLKGNIEGKLAVLNGLGGAGEDTVPTAHPAISVFFFNQKTKKIKFIGYKTVSVNTALKPKRVFITTKSGKIILVPVK